MSAIGRMRGFAVYVFAAPGSGPVVLPIPGLLVVSRFFDRTIGSVENERIQ